MFLFDTKIIADAITKASTPLWVTVLLAVVPVGISIVVFIRQNRIMKQQNNIALFDKRYELFRELEQLHINLFPILQDKNFENFIKFLNPDECAEFFMKTAFYKIISFTPSRINDELCFPSSRQKQNLVMEVLIKLEKVEFVFSLNEVEKSEYRNILNCLSNILYKVTGSSQDGIGEKKEITYKISSKDLEPLQKLASIVEKLRKQLELHK